MINIVFIELNKHVVLFISRAKTDKKVVSMVDDFQGYCE